MPAETETTSTTSQRIAITGASGLIGRHLVARLRAAGHRVQTLVRRPATPGADEIYWNPPLREIDRAALAGVNAVIHLAGENIAGGRWTARRKAILRASRTDPTGLLCETLARLTPPPHTLISASAVGYYGDRGDELLTEKSPAGSGFLAEVCCAWEAATAPALEAGIRVVHPRFGVVLATEGGALAKMLTPFKLGLGGRLGNGRQYMSWITLADAGRAIEHLIAHSDTHGAVNIVAPNAVTNAEFVAALGRVLRRPTFASVPARAVRWLFGEMGTALLLASTRVVPQRLTDGGFRCEHAEIEAALRAVCSIQPH